MAEAKKVTHQQFRTAFTKSEERYNATEMTHAPGPVASLDHSDVVKAIADIQAAVDAVTPVLGWLPGKYSQAFIDTSAILKSVARQLK